MKFPTLFLMVLCCSTFGCNGQTVRQTSSVESENLVSAPDFPPLGKSRKLQPGISRYEVVLDPKNKSRKVWIYVPEGKEKVPCILVAAAGSRLIDGASLGTESDAEHLPYVKAGFAVVAYDIDGNPKDDSDDASLKAVTAFLRSNGGLTNQRIALDYSLARTSFIDRDKIFIAGHSSAGTHALFVGANEPRVKGVVAFAPAADPESFLGENLRIYDEHVPGIKRLIADSSPSGNVEKLNIPVFIFHSRDDSTVPIAMTEKFVAELKKMNAKVEFVLVDKGGHYSSMVNDGIPKAIAWLKALV